MKDLIMQADQKLSAIAKTQRAQAELQAALNAKIEAVTAKWNKKLLPLDDQLAEQNADLEEFSNQHKDDLLDGKKSVKLASGSIGWRHNKGKATFIDKDAVIKVMRSLRLGKFIRTTEAVNQTALNDNDAAKNKLMAELRANHPGVVKETPASDAFWIKPL